MSEKPDGGSAFPRPYHPSQGMTLRDYFAGQVLGSSPEQVRAVVVGANNRRVMGEGFDYDIIEAQALAIAAYTIADAMIAERGK